MIQTRAQFWAKTAFTNVTAVKLKSEDLQSDYITLAQRFGSMVRKSGLVQTLAFLSVRATPNGAHALFLDQLAGHIVKGGVDPGEGGEALLERCREADLTDYMWLNRRLLEVSVWYRRYAEALLA